jgi:hypothetical protein
MAREVIEVDVGAVKCGVEPRVIGINVDYLVDHDANRPAGARPLVEALREMGVKSLRFPGGDKSDWHLWATPPFDRPSPAIACAPRKGVEQPEEGKPSPRRMNFDEFMEMSRALGAEPTLVACHDALYAAGCTVTKERLIETAAAWVKYANVTKGYGVKYWEIGNEGYIDRTVSPYDYASNFVEFAKAMKAVDPTIWVGANGPPRAEGGGRHEATKDTPWWKVVFEAAADQIDFVPVHVYSCWQWKTYDFYREHSPGYPEAYRDAISPIEAARRYGPPGFADRLHVTVTETNAADWSEEGWPKINDLGHGLVVFDIFGTLLEIGRIDNAQLWNTRWVSHPPDTPSLWDAVDDMNGLQPTGRALAIWSQFLGEQMVAVSEPRRMRTFATHTPGSGRLAVCIINKEAKAREVSVALKGAGEAQAQVWSWQGEGPDDRQPVWAGPEKVAVRAGSVEVSLLGDSLTVVDVRT